MTNVEHLATELREMAESIAHDVGTQVLQRRKAGFNWTTKSTSTDVVTEIDTWSEETIVEAITSRRPDDGLLGEEGAFAAGSTGVTWVIDPVDGTTNFLYDLPGYSVSIGLEYEGAPLAGAVYDPVRAELFSGAAGQGATVNGTSISASSLDTLATALVGTGFSYDPEDRVRQATVLPAIVPAVRDIRRFGGAALDFCAVACGRLDAYFERGVKPWDSAAGSIIASEAGAIVQTGALTYAVGPNLAPAFIDLMNTSGA